MSLMRKEFEKYLALYGCDIEQWPENIRADARQVQKQFGMEELVAEYAQLERMLQARQQIKPANAFLAERIIVNARHRRRNITPVSIAVWLKGLFADVMIPQPVYALAAMLIIGIGIGFSTPDNNAGDDSLSLQTAFTDDGGVL